MYLAANFTTRDMPMLYIEDNGHKFELGIIQPVIQSLELLITLRVGAHTTHISIHISLCVGGS